MKKKRAAQRTAKRQPQRPPRRGIDYGKKRFRIFDPLSAVITLAVAVLSATLAAVSNAKGFDKTWYGDILTTVVGVFCVFAVVNLFYLFWAGISVEGGRCFLGSDDDKKPIFFDVEELSDIRLSDEDGTPIPTDGKRFLRVRIEFILKNGRVLTYEANWLTARTYRSMRAFFEI